MKILYLYLICMGLLFAIDMLWLGVFAKNFYKKELSFIMSDKVDWVAGISFYLLFVGGVVYFAVLPGLAAQSWWLALVNGAVLGLLCYATYDLTNKALIAQWPVIVVVVDIAWGIVLTGGVSLLTYYIGTKI